MDEKKKILLVEDTEELAEALKTHLLSLGYELDHAEHGEKALEMARSEQYDLLILDVMLPRLDGLEVCRTLRAENYSKPILMLTSKSDEMDEVNGLEAGADDYVTKPFGLAALDARVKALLRRPQWDEQSSTADVSESIVAGGLEIFPQRRKVLRDGAEIELTAREFDLLCLFASNPGRAYRRSELLRLIWETDFESYQYAISSLILRLRRKIEEDPGNPRYILTVRGIGYRFAEEGGLK